MDKLLHNKPVAIVLGGTFPHIALIRNLQQRGYYTILVDYYENPPAKRFADEHIRESTLDQERVLEIARSLNVKLVISTCVDQANVTACYIAEKLGLPAPYSYETALHVTNKILMKEKMIGHNISTAKFIRVRDIKDCKNYQLRFPVIVKPTDNNSSKGVRKASDHSELIRFLEDALKISRCDEAIIEEYKVGREIGVDYFIKNREATIIMTKERRKIPAREDPIQQIYGCIWPADISERIYNDFKKIGDQIAGAFNLDNTPLMIQAIVNGNDINIIEFAPRIGGGESFRIIKLSTGFDIIDAAIDSLLGIQVKLDHKSPGTYYAENFVYAKQGFFGSISGHEGLLGNGAIEYLDNFKTKGAVIGAELSSNNRVGVFTVKSNNASKLVGKIAAVIEKIEVYDIHGEPIMRKDIYSRDFG